MSNPPQQPVFQTYPGLLDPTLFFWMLMIQLWDWRIIPRFGWMAVGKIVQSEGLKLPALRYFFLLLMRPCGELCGGTTE